MGKCLKVYPKPSSGIAIITCGVLKVAVGVLKVAVTIGVREPKEADYYFIGQDECTFSYLVLTFFSKCKKYRYQVPYFSA